MNGFLIALTLCGQLMGFTGMTSEGVIISLRPSHMQNMPAEYQAELKEIISTTGIFVMKLEEDSTQCV